MRHSKTVSGICDASLVNLYVTPYLSKKHCSDVLAFITDTSVFRKPVVLFCGLIAGAPFAVQKFFMLSSATYSRTVPQTPGKLRDQTAFEGGEGPIS
jgi:hypothetical protein